MAQITLVEGRTRVWCAAFPLHLGTLGAGSSRFAAESLTAADGLPRWFRGGRGPVQIGVDGVALAGSGESLDGSMLGGSSWDRFLGDLREGRWSQGRRVISLEMGRFEDDERKDAGTTHVL